MRGKRLQARNYYLPFDMDGDGSWHFYIPEKDGPMPDCGDMLVGPYHNYDQCYQDAVNAERRALGARQ